MSIVAYVGKPGSGKSYGVVENVITKSLANGRTIVTNIPLKLDLLARDFPEGEVVQFDSKEALDNPDFFDTDSIQGAIWVIDECWRYWPSGLQANKIPLNQQEFFTEHRHSVGENGFTTEIVLVTQSLTQLCSFIRELIEETFRATKLTAAGSKKKFRVDVFSGAIRRIEGGTPNRQLYGTYKKSVFQYYKSHTKNKTDFAAGMEEKADDRNNIWKSPFIRYVVPIFVLIAIYSFYNAFSYFGRASQDQDPVEPFDDSFQHQTFANSQQGLIKPNIQAALLKMDIGNEPLPVSQSWRIVGEINDKLILWSDNGERVVDRFHCSKFSNTRETYCVLNGELVTWYSSKRPLNEDSEDREYFGGVSDVL